MLNSESRIFSPINDALVADFSEKLMGKSRHHISSANETPKNGATKSSQVCTTKHSSPDRCLTFRCPDLNKKVCSVVPKLFVSEPELVQQLIETDSAMYVMQTLKDA